MARTYRRPKYFQDPTVRNIRKKERIHDKDYLSDYKREHKLDPVSGDVTLGYREASGSPMESRRAMRRGGDIQVRRGMEEYYDDNGMPNGNGNGMSMMQRRPGSMGVREIEPKDDMPDEMESGVPNQSRRSGSSGSNGVRPGKVNIRMV